MKGGFERVKNSEMNRCTPLEYNDIVDGDNLANVYSRILKDQLELLSPRDLYFQHDIFSIDPVVSKNLISFQYFVLYRYNLVARRPVISGFGDDHQNL
jgi:hypothetical protein